MHSMCWPRCMRDGARPGCAARHLIPASNEIQ
jgi:hypothetical protein